MSEGMVVLLVILLLGAVALTWALLYERASKADWLRCEIRDENAKAVRARLITQRRWLPKYVVREAEFWLAEEEQRREEAKAKKVAR